MVKLKYQPFSSGNYLISTIGWKSSNNPWWNMVKLILNHALYKINSHQHQHRTDFFCESFWEIRGIFGGLSPVWPTRLTPPPTSESGDPLRCIVPFFEVKLNGCLTKKHGVSAFALVFQIHGFVKWCYLCMQIPTAWWMFLSQKRDRKLTLKSLLFLLFVDIWSVWTPSKKKQVPFFCLPQVFF